MERCGIDVRKIFGSRPTTIGGIINALQANEEIDHNKVLFRNQLLALAYLAVSLVLVGIVELFFPKFFSYPFFAIAPSLNGISHYWPLFVYAAIMAYVSSVHLKSSHLDGQILGWSVLTSVLAGLWEELGFRWLFICTAMMGLVISNFLLSSFLAFVFGGIFILAGIYGLSQKKPIAKVGGVLLIFCGISACLYCYGADPVYWINDHIILPVINFVTLGQFHETFYNNDYPKLFVFGMIAANAKFRDGHKYQGFYGLMNSWIVGFILMTAMLNWGLWTAVIIHAIYDIEFALIHYVFRKTDIL